MCMVNIHVGVTPCQLNRNTSPFRFNTMHDHRFLFRLKWNLRGAFVVKVDRNIYLSMPACKSKLSAKQILLRSLRRIPKVWLICFTFRFPRTFPKLHFAFVLVSAAIEMHFAQNSSSIELLFSFWNQQRLSLMCANWQNRYKFMWNTSRITAPDTRGIELGVFCLEFVSLG